MALTIGRSFFSLFIVSERWNKTRWVSRQLCRLKTKPIQKPVICLFAKLHTLLASKPINTGLCLLFSLSLSDWCSSISEKYLPGFHILSSHPELALPLLCHSSKVIACEQPVRGSIVNFLVHVSSLRKFRTPSSLPTLRAQSTTNLFLWHVEVLLHYNPSGLVFSFCCRNTLWPVIVWIGLE